MFGFLFGVLGLIVAFVVLARTNDLRRRVTHIERYLQEKTASLGVHAGAAEQTHDAQHSAQAEAQAAAAHALTAPAGSAAGEWPRIDRSDEPDPLARFFAWVREDWLMKLGGLLVLLGLGWFVTYAIAEGWIGEMGRIALGYALSAVVLAVGWRRARAFVTQGSVLMFVGSAGIVLTTFAARELYDMFTPLIGLVLIFSASAFLGLASIVLKRRELAVANVLLAALAPVLVDADFGLVTLFTYLLVLAAGSVWVGVVTGWRVLPFLSLVIVGLYSVEALDTFYYRNNGELETGLVFAFVFTMLFFAVSILGMRIAKTVRVIDILTALGSGMFLLLWILAAAPDEWQSLLLVAWTIVFAAGAYVATHVGAGRSYFFSYAGVGVALLGTATALELEGPHLAIAFTCEAALLVWLGYKVTGMVRAVPVLLLPGIIPLLLTLGSMASRDWRDGIFHADAFAVVFFALVVLGLGYFFYEERLRLAEDVRGVVKDIAQSLFVLAGLYGLALIWLVSHALFTGDAGTTIALVVYALLGGMFYLMGHASNVAWQRIIGAVLFIGVAAWLIFVEMAEMRMEEKVLTFIGIGVIAIVFAWVVRGRHTGPTAIPGDDPSHDNTTQ